MLIWLLHTFLAAHHHQQWADQLGTGHYTWDQLQRWLGWALRHGFTLPSRPVL